MRAYANEMRISDDEKSQDKKKAQRWAEQLARQDEARQSRAMWTAGRGKLKDI